MKAEVHNLRTRHTDSSLRARLATLALLELSHKRWDSNVGGETAVGTDGCVCSREIQAEPEEYEEKPRTL